MNTRLVRSVQFECIHRYEIPEWSPEKNREIFGACYTPHGHGHSYKMDVCVSGSVNKDTGMVINLKDLDEVLKEVVVLVDKKHLNFEVEEFKKTVPTTENLAKFLYSKLNERIKSTGVLLEKIRLHENDDLWVDQS